MYICIYMYIDRFTLFDAISSCSTLLNLLSIPSIKTSSVDITTTVEMGAIMVATGRGGSPREGAAQEQKF
jgi:hypothetical protein